MDINSIPTRSFAAHSRTEALKGDVATMQHVYESFARSGLSSEERGRLSSIETDWARAQALRGDLKVDGSWIASGEAEPQDIARAAAHQAELKEVEGDLRKRLAAEHQLNRQRVESRQGYGPLTVFESGGRIIVNTHWTDKGVKYGLQRPLGENFFDLCAEPVQAGAPENLTFLRIDMRDHSEEMQLCPADKELRISHLSPLSGAEGELVQHDDWRCGLEKLSEFQVKFATQVLHDLGMAWPSLLPCPHCS